MKKILLIFMFIGAFARNSNAQENSFPRITFGAEWSYIATFQSGWHHNFFSPEGYRVDTSGNKFIYHSNVEAYLHAGYNISKNWNIALYLGMTGISDPHKAVPASIRGTYYVGDDPSRDRWFTYIDLGSGICLKKPPQEILTGKIGGGYRISLSRNTKLDFIAALRMTYTHPTVVYEDQIIPMEKVNRNNAYLSAISFGIGLTF